MFLLQYVSVLPHPAHSEKLRKDGRDGKGSEARGLLANYE